MDEVDYLLEQSDVGWQPASKMGNLSDDNQSDCTMKWKDRRQGELKIRRLTRISIIMRTFLPLLQSQSLTTGSKPACQAN